MEVKWETESRRGERDFTAAPAGRLRLGGGCCCFLRRRSGGGLVAPSWPAAARNPSAGSGRGMLERAVAFPEEGDDASGGQGSGVERGAAGGFAGLKMARGGSQGMDAAAGLDPPPPQSTFPRMPCYVLACPVPCPPERSLLLSAECSV